MAQTYAICMPQLVHFVHLCNVSGINATMVLLVRGCVVVRNGTPKYLNQ